MHKNTAAYYVITGLVLLNVLAWIAVLQMSRSRFLEVVFFDVGQGDSIFIESPEGHQILIDGGPSSDVVEKLAGEMPFFDRTIDLVILTHPDYDHLQGLLHILDRYQVENILWTGIRKETKVFAEWLSKIKKEKANIIFAERGQSIGTGDWQMEILYPKENLSGQLFEKNSNNTSVVAKLIFKENTFLFPGDITKKIEKELLIVGDNLKSQVLKAAHHGSKSSNSEEFLEAVDPELAVISSGKDNRYGHPHKEVLARLDKFGIRVLRTDLFGDIKMISYGSNYSIKP